MSDEKKTAAAVDKAPAVQAVAYCGPFLWTESPKSWPRSQRNARS